MYRVEARKGRLEVEIEAKGARVEKWYLLGVGPKLEGEREGGPARRKGLLVHAEDSKAGARVKRGVLTLASRQLRYSYSLKSRLGASQDLERGAGSPGSYVLRGDRYLLVPGPTLLPDGVSIELRFRGLEPFLPWPCEREGDEWVAYLNPSDLRQLGFHAFGPRKRFELELPGDARWEVALLEGDLEAGDEKIRSWITQAAADAISVAGGSPRKRVSIVLAPVSSSNPAPFGRVLYSQPRSAAIYVGQQATAAAFDDDWLATHELMHTLHPRFVGQVRFMSEGIASYYQCLAPIRSKREPAKALWGVLARGVATGQVEALGRSLAEVTGAIHTHQAYRAVYWGGALLALELDLEIRRATEGKRGLEHVLAQLRARPGVTLGELGAAVDAMAGVEIWRAIRRAHLRGQALKRGTALLRSLGIGPEGLDPEASAAEWRIRLELGS